MQVFNCYLHFIRNFNSSFNDRRSIPCDCEGTFSADGKEIVNVIVCTVDIASFINNLKRPRILLRKNISSIEA